MKEQQMQITVDCEISDVIAQGVEDGVVNAMFKLSIAYLAAMIVIGVVVFFFFQPEKDSTDPIDGHSGLSIKVDAMTGCQYLTTTDGGLTPRMDKSGAQLCGDKK